MTDKIALAVYLNRQNKNSFAAIIGAIESSELHGNLPVVFLRDEKELKEKIANLAKKYKKIILAFSFASFQAKEILFLSKEIKKEFPDNVVLLAGGPHPSGDPKGVLGNGFDFVIIGEGEKTIIDFLKIASRGENYYEKIGNLAYFKNNEFIFTFKNPSINLDDYLPFTPAHKIFGPIEITRGCPWGCKYCQTSYLFGRQIRHRGIPEICRYVKILKENNRLDIRFITPNALSYGSPDGKKVNLSAIENMLKSVREIIDEDGRIFFGSFPSEVRPEQVFQKALDIIKKYCDNDNLIIGAQSGSQKMLDYLCRGHKVEDIYKAAELIIKNGLKVNIDFIFGLSAETREDIEETFKAMEDLVKMGAQIHGHTFMSLPGTPLARFASGKISVEDKKRLKKLEAGGKLYGEWEKQENH